MALLCNHCGKYYNPHDPTKIIGCDCDGAVAYRNRRIDEAIERAFFKRAMTRKPLIIFEGRPELKLKKTGKITHTVELTGKDIMDLMANLGGDYTPGPEATAEFKVPSGGDYSGSRIDFSDAALVVVKWTTEE